MRLVGTVLGAVALMLMTAPGAAAQTGASVSGGCDDGSGGGGAAGLGPGPNLFDGAQADTGVQTDGTVSGTTVDLVDADDAALAVAALAEGAALDGASGNPSNSCDGDDSWLGVFVTQGGSTTTVVCYDGSPHVAQSGTPGECHAWDENGPDEPGL